MAQKSAGDPLYKTRSPFVISKKANRKVLNAFNKGSFGEWCAISAVPTVHVLLFNCGFFNGLGRQAVYAILDPIVPLRVLMQSNTDYSLVTFGSVEDAVVAKDKCDGQYVRTLVDSSFWTEVLSCTFLKGPKVTVHPVYVHLRHFPQNPVLKSTLPKGLKLFEECITCEEEASLMELFSSGGQAGSGGQPGEGSCLKLRRVEHYGYRFEYGKNTVDPGKPLRDAPIPGRVREVLKHMVEQEMISCLPDQLTVNEYQPGQGIPPHADTHSAFEGEIASLSLGSHCVMVFRRDEDGEEEEEAATSVPVLLSARSLMVMTGESRYIWTHGIAAKKMDVVDGTMHGYHSPVHGKVLEETTELKEREIRISCTFRKVKMEPSCNCRHRLCDMKPQALS